MAAVLTPKFLSFPHNILHDSRDLPLFMKMEERTPPRPSLPPISSLIGNLDKQTESGPLRSPALDQHQKVSSGSHGPHPPTPDRVSFGGSPRTGLPPTPPLPGTSSFDFAHRQALSETSPGGKGNAQSGYFAVSPSITSPEAYARQKSSYPPIPETHHWNSSSSPTSSRRASNESTVLSHVQVAKTDFSYPDPSESTSPNSGLAQQRPLPVNFPPPLPSPTQQLPPIDPQMAVSPYQHHHHYPATSSPAYSQTTDRYQCPTCQKAFSRPSSLKIHTYSHTGEKPFKCKYEGCGKYFSVRSNMKRHEKGCHGVDTSSAGGNSPKSN